MNVEHAQTPTWANAEHSAVNLMVKFSGLPDYVPFCALPTDVEGHGTELYHQAIDGAFGPIGDPTPTLQTTLTEVELASNARMYRDQLLASCDMTQLPDFPLTPRKKAEWSAYRLTLRDITKQTGFPHAIVWPEKPAA